MGIAGSDEAEVVAKAKAASGGELRSTIGVGKRRRFRGGVHELLCHTR